MHENTLYKQEDFNIGENLGMNDLMYINPTMNLGLMNSGVMAPSGYDSVMMNSAFALPFKNTADMDFMSQFMQPNLLFNFFNKMESGCGTYVVDHKKLESKYSPLIEKIAKEEGVDPNVIKSMVRQESGFNPNAKSNAGAMGLMQLMPGTAKDMKVKDPYNAEENIRGGTKYMAYLLKRYDGNYRKAVAAYNGGMGNVDKKGINFCEETKKYHNKVLGTA